MSNNTHDGHGLITFPLLFRVASMEVRDDSEIDWKLLSDDDWNLWSAHTTQRQWRKLKQTILGHEEMGFQGSSGALFSIVTDDSDNHYRSD